MKLNTRILKTFSFRNRKLKGLSLVFIFFIASFIGIFSIFLPSLLIGTSSEDKSLDVRSGSNLGYEETIRVYVDKHGNLTVLGSFQGPQTTPDVNWSLPEYDLVWLINFDVVSTNMKDYYYQRGVQLFEPEISKQDAYLSFYFLYDDEGMMASGMENPVALNEIEMYQAAAILKSDIERAFGIPNNFTSTPLSIDDHMGEAKVITYGLNFSPVVDYSYFIMYLADHTPPGLSDSILGRINLTRSRLNWIYTHQPQFTEQIISSVRDPLGDYNSSFECNVFVNYPEFFGPAYGGSPAPYSFDLNAVLDTPFTPLSLLNESAYSSSEIDIVVENGNITSLASPYHIPQYLGIDHDWWLLLNASTYDIFVDGLGTVADIQVNFTAPVVEFFIGWPFIPPTSSQGDVPILFNMTTSLPFPPLIDVEFYDAATFNQRIFDDLSYMYGFPQLPLDRATALGPGLYSGTWNSTYRYPNGIYYMYLSTSFANFSGLTKRSQFNFMPGGVIYEYSPLFLNNSGQIQLDIFQPTPNDVVSKMVNITANITSPEPIFLAEYQVFNISHYTFYYAMGLTPMASGPLVNIPLTSLWTTPWDSTTVPSTEDYILRVQVTDTNTTFFQDILITVNNTLYQENIPLYAPMGAHWGYGYDLYIGSVETPQISDPISGGGGPPMPIMFYGYGVDYGMDFTSHLYEDVLAVFVAADNNHSRNLMWDQISTDIPENDFGMIVWMWNDTPESRDTASAIVAEAQAAFNIPFDLPHLDTYIMNMGGPDTYMFVYGANYSTINYQDFIDKFHSSVPSGLAGVYTKENMTQAGINSTIFFGYMDPEIMPIPGLENFNLGKNAFISPIISFPNYFDPLFLGDPSLNISLNAIFPQITQYNACSPAVASHVLSGFGPTALGTPLGAIAMNANITSWYPQDPSMINVTPLTGMISPNLTNMIKFTLLDTSLAFPYGLLTTDNVIIRFTGPYLTNNLMSPAEGQSVELDDSNVTIESQSLAGYWNETQYILTQAGAQSWFQSPLIYNGDNWTDVIYSQSFSPGLYQLRTYTRDNLSLWAVNMTQIYINNSVHSSMLAILINEWGDVEFLTGDPSGTGIFGYGLRLGYDPSIEEYNDTNLNQIVISISDEQNPNLWSNMFTGENWNFLVAVLGSGAGTEEQLTEISGPIIEDLERVFDIPGLLQKAELAETNPYGAPLMGALCWAMNYTPSRDYNYFLDHYETVRKGNITSVFSKENLLKANQSSILYGIVSPWNAKQGLQINYGVPNLNGDEYVGVAPYMRFEDVFDYSTVNQSHSFSLANLLGISEINTDYEQSMTYGRSDILTSVFCGNYTDSQVYPNNPNFTFYIPFGLPGYQFLMLNKSAHFQEGINQTDDIRFNFTAPYTNTEVISPLPGSTVHGDVNVIVNATMVAPSTVDVGVTVLPAGYYDTLLVSQMIPSGDFTLTYNSVNRYWEGTWETLDISLPNGWYDLVFTFTDGVGRFQRNISRVYVHNTYYDEQVGLQIDQFGNVSASFQIFGNILKDDWNDSIPEYQDVFMAALQATNSYAGSANYTKELLTSWLGTSPNDIGFAVMFSSEISEAEAILAATPLKDDCERVFGIEGTLNFIEFSPFYMGMPGMGALKIVYFGANYTPTLTYSDFVDYFHQSTPSGLNNTIASALTGADSFLQWVITTDPSIIGGSIPPNIDLGLSSMIMGYLFDPQYFGANYMEGTLATRNISLAEFFNVPQILHAPSDVADTMRSSMSIRIENANVTSWYPDIPDKAKWEPGARAYYAQLAERNVYQSYDDDYDDRAWDLNVDDINVTFDEPMSRPIVVTPLAGATVNGTTSIQVFVENTTPVNDVRIKIYTETEYDALGLAALFGGGGMPSSRPPGMYGEQAMNELGGGYWNYSWDAYQHPDGPIWFEVVVATAGGYYSYNSTKVTISNSNPLAANVISPSDGATVSGVMKVSAQIINSTPIFRAQGAVMGVDPTQFFAEVVLEPEGGNIYSGYIGTQGIKNGTYDLILIVIDIFGAVTFNTSVSFDIANPVIFEINLLHPTSTLDWSKTAELIASTTGPYYTKTMDYTISQQYYNPDWNSYAPTGPPLAVGSMVDPDSTWVAQIDTSHWPKMLNISDGQDWDIYEAYYLIEITGTDTQYGITQYSERFKLGEPETLTAEITSPLDGWAVEGIFNTTVQVTNLTDVINTIEGRVLDSSERTIQALKFNISGGTLAEAEVFSYPHPNGYYTIEVWGETANGSFYDSITSIFANTIIFSIEGIYPGESDTVTGTITAQLDIQNVTDLSYIWLDINEPDGPTLRRLDSFSYNGTSGYWEQQWDSWEVPDGDYELFCGAKDSNNIELYDDYDFSIDNPPRVWITEPLGGSIYQEYDPIPIEVFVPDTDMDYVELWVNMTFIMNLTADNGNWTGEWSYTIGKIGINNLQIKAYDTGGQVNDTQWTWVNITPYTPPAEHADVYEVILTNTTGGEQSTFTEGETVEYHATIRGDAGSGTYVVTAQTNDPLLHGYLEYNETVTVTAGLDIEVVFSYTIAIGAPTGTYTVQILVWTDWPWDGGLCVDFITITFEVV
ncbi:MAG: hypothetical protein HWN66_01465 [Candidatus Helarchaeota archaeon]|nr:hypothetical protein [Candidatus Helarchaeota archaeon]